MRRYFILYSIGIVQFRSYFDSVVYVYTMYRARVRCAEIDCYFVRGYIACSKAKNI